MKRLLTIFALLVAVAVEVDAQSIRLGDRIPELQFDKDYGLESKEYVCLTFIHTESAPCLTAIEGLTNVVSSHTATIELVFINGIKDGTMEDISHLTAGVDHTLIYDIDSRIFKAFGIEYVPYTIVYSSKRKRIEWFGPACQLTAQTLERVINK